jgi:hypothetical protein
MSYISESSKYLEKAISSVQGKFGADSNSEKSDPIFLRDGPVMRSNAHQCREVSNNSRLHPSGRYGNTSGHSSEFEKIQFFLCRHGLGRQLAPV